MDTMPPSQSKPERSDHRSKTREGRSRRHSSKRGKSSSRSSRKRSGRRRLLLVSGLLAMLLVCGGLLFFLRRAKAPAGRTPDQTGKPAARAVAEPATPLPPEARAPEWIGPRPLEVATAFTAATTHAKRLQWVCQPDAVAEAMAEFFTHGPGSTEQITDLTPIADASYVGRTQALFEVTMADGSTRQLAVPYEEDGRAKVDFKSYGRICSTPWSALLEGTSATAPEMRVLLKASSYYNRDFADERSWLCLIASSPDLEDPIFLYARRDQADLGEFLRNAPGRNRRYTVSIQATDDGWRHRQFVLKKVLHAGWLGE